MQNYLEHKLEGESLFQTRFDDGGFVVWRPLPWSDYKKYRDARGILGPKIDIQIEESVYERCVVYSTYDTPAPENLTEEEAKHWLAESRAEQLAGVAPTVVKSIMFMSGATSGKTIIKQLDQFRPFATNLEDYIVALICRAFPAYTPEQVEGLPWQTILKRAAQAEVLLNSPIEIVDQEAERQKVISAQKFNLQKEIKEVTEGLRAIGGEPSREGVREMHEMKRAKQAEVAELRKQYFANRGG